MAEENNKEFERIIEKIKKAQNILVALSRDPSADEMAAAIGLTLALEGAGKHTTAIYSGKTPNALAFLEPEKTFEPNTNSLQDFIIALDKRKADHIEYKIEGDFVKVYITPYKTTISEDDVEFSHGDYNVDLVISINVPTADDLDAALLEYGRIMHDSSSVNITNGIPGQFCEIEWSDNNVSSVSEMVLKLVEALSNEGAMVSRDIATAILTGIISATDRFSNNKTTSDTMNLASKLMEAGADQQMIVSKMAEMPEEKVEEPVAEPKIEEPEEKIEEKPEEKVEEEPEVSAEQELSQIFERSVPEAPETPEEEPQPIPVAEPVVPVIEEPKVEEPVAEVPVVEVPKEEEPKIEEPKAPAPNEKPVLEPIPTTEMPVDYSQMIESELAEPLPNPAMTMTPAAPAYETTPVQGDFAAMQAGAMSPNEIMNSDMQPGLQQVEVQPIAAQPVTAPSMTAQPVATPPMTAQPVMMGAQPIETITAASAPVEPMPMPAMEVTPPPVVAPDFGAMPPAETEAQPEPTMVMPQVAPGMEQAAPMQTVQSADINPVIIQPETNGPVDPSAFKIPGM